MKHTLIALAAGWIVAGSALPALGQEAGSGVFMELELPVAFEKQGGYGAVDGDTLNSIAGQGILVGYSGIGLGYHRFNAGFSQGGLVSYSLPSLLGRVALGSVLLQGGLGTGSVQFVNIFTGGGGVPMPIEPMDQKVSHVYVLMGYQGTNLDISLGYHSISAKMGAKSGALVLSNNVDFSINVVTLGLGLQF
ncbi:MAG: hypothetical protein OEW12_02755 [Deltaproteobacteria bacterium]|nr:hypothetical protein [Deltaproteobacteria bacterium]